MKGLLFWFFNKMKDLPKGQSESVYRRRTDTTMAKRIKRIDGKYNSKQLRATYLYRHSC